MYVVYLFVLFIYFIYIPPIWSVKTTLGGLQHKIHNKYIYNLFLIQALLKLKEDPVLSIFHRAVCTQW